MKRIYVIESLCNGCRLCETFCSSLEGGVFGPGGTDVDSGRSRIRVLKVPGEEQDIPLVDCSGRCVRPIYGDGVPTCVALCPTGALVFEDGDGAAARRLELVAARQAHSLFNVVAPWKWPLPWSGRPGDVEGD